MNTFINLLFFFFFIHSILSFLTCMLYRENVLETGFEDAVQQKHTLLDHPVKGGRWLPKVPVSASYAG